MPPGENSIAQGLDRCYVDGMEYIGSEFLVILIASRIRRQGGRRRNPCATVSCFVDGRIFQLYEFEIFEQMWCSQISCEPSCSPLPAHRRVHRAPADRYLQPLINHYRSILVSSITICCGVQPGIHNLTVRPQPLQ
jgi:hypothetical protein